MPKPTAEYVTALHKRLLGIWSPAHQKWAKTDTYLNGTFALWPEKDKDRPSYHPPTASAKLDQAVSVQLPQTPTVHRFPRSKARSKQAEADIVEEWLVNFIAEASLREAQPTVSAIKRYLMAYGYAVLEGPLLDSLVLARRQDLEPKLEDYEDERQHEFAVRRWRAAKQQNPLRLRAPHPQEVLLHPEEKQPREAVIVKQWFKGDLWELLKRKREEGVKNVKMIEFDPKDDKYYEIVKATEYWNEEWHSLIGPDEAMLYTEPNWWGFVLYQHCFSGWGMRPTNESSLAPEHQAVGLLDQTLETIKAQAQQATSEHNALIEAAWYQYGYDGPMNPEEAAQQLGSDALLQGKKEQFWVKEVPQLPQWLFQVGGKTNEYIETGTFSRGLGGFRRPGVTTVGQEAILDSRGERKFDVPSEQINHLFTIAAQKTLQLLEIFGEKITIRDTTIGPDDVKGNYAVEVTFQLDDPVMRAQERSLGMEEVEKGGKSWRRYWDDVGEENAVERVREAQVEQMLRSDQIQSALVEYAAAEFPRRMAAKTGSQLLGPDGRPIRRGAQTSPANMNPAVGAMQQRPTEPATVSAANGVVPGVNNGAVAGF